MIDNIIYSGQWCDLDCRPRVSKQEKIQEYRKIQILKNTEK